MDLAVTKKKKKKKGFNEHVDEELSWIHRCEHRESKTEESLLALREDDSQRWRHLDLGLHFVIGTLMTLKHNRNISIKDETIQYASLSIGMIVTSVISQSMASHTKNQMLHLKREHYWYTISTDILS